ncbi:MAG: molecular chaperone, small heat shock protein [uncultured archaeon A07HR60]|jgi:HSP20 family protein|nr:MAG: molecular chaperone, small heat shock protein [uncultured archaeon A07HR60]
MTERYNPFDELEKLFNRMNREFEDISAPVESRLGGGDFRVDVRETTDTVEILADLPGFSQGELTVTVKDDRLRITGDRSVEAELDDIRYHRRERPRGSVSRRLHLPADVDGTAAEATYNAGVLSVTLPKESPDMDEGHTIEVQ